MSPEEKGARTIVMRRALLMHIKSDVEFLEDFAQTPKLRLEMSAARLRIHAALEMYVETWDETGD